MTYHFGVPRRPSDNLYFCLDIPSVKLPTQRTIDLSQEIVKTIPKEIMTELRKVESETLSNPTHDKIAMIDYELDLQQSDLSPYKNASIPEVLRFASEGTNIALEVLSDTKTRKETWKNDKEIAEAIQQRVNAKLTTKKELFFGFHFVGNPVFVCSPLVDNYLRGVLKNYDDGNRQVALDFLYDAEKNGNINDAVNKHIRFLNGFAARIQFSLSAEFNSL